jgi:hypothetical protein
MHIKEMSNRQLENFVFEAQEELQERVGRVADLVFAEALTMGEGVQDISLTGFEFQGVKFFRHDYIEWLEGRGSHHPASKKTLDEWHDYVAQQERKHSMNTTGA